VTAYLVYDVFTDDALRGQSARRDPGRGGARRGPPPEDRARVQLLGDDLRLSARTIPRTRRGCASSRRRRRCPSRATRPSGRRWRFMRISGGPAEMVLELGVGPIPCSGRGRERALRHARPARTAARARPGIGGGLRSASAGRHPDDRATCAGHGLGRPALRLRRTGGSRSAGPLPARYSTAFRRPGRRATLALRLRGRSLCPRRQRGRGCGCSRRSTTFPRIRPRAAPPRRSARCWRDLGGRGP
jgi:hypothetical protein